MPIITLLPKDKEERTASPLQIRWLFWTTWLIFIAVILGTIFIFLYKNALDEKISAAQKELKNLQSKEKINQIKELTDFSDQLKNLKTILNNHSNTTKIFSLVEEATHPKVYWTNLNFMTETSTIILAGKAANFDVLSNQLTSLQQNNNIKNSELTGISIDNKNKLITFNVTLELK